MQRAAEKCGNPQSSSRAFHVAGTNGKGSTCTMLESIMRAQGYRTGLFTSPHLVRFEERFKIDGVSVEEKKWTAVYFDLESIIEEFDLTFFEASTLIAFELFKREGVEWAVYETGMGGRLDSTNILVPEVSVITNLSMDHTEYLGPTILHIAEEKLGIVKNGVPLVMAMPDRDSIVKLAQKVCSDRKTDVVFVKGPGDFSLEKGTGRQKFIWNNREFHIRLYGEHQVKNAVLALTAAEKTGAVDLSSMVRGLDCAKMPGRFQMEKVKGKRVVFDVAHNREASTVLVDSLRSRFPDKAVLMVIGIMKDKDMADMLSTLVKCADSALFCSPDTPRAATVEELERNTPDCYRKKIQCAQSVKHALDLALCSGCEIICITGSFFTVGEAFMVLDLKI